MHRKQRQHRHAQRAKDTHGHEIGGRQRHRAFARAPLARGDVGHRIEKPRRDRQQRGKPQLAGRGRAQHQQHPDRAKDHRQNPHRPDPLAIDQPRNQQHKDRRRKQPRPGLRHRQEAKACEIDQQRRAMHQTARHHRAGAVRPQLQPHERRGHGQQRQPHQRPREMELPDARLGGDDAHEIVGKGHDHGIGQHETRGLRGAVDGKGGGHLGRVSLHCAQ